MPRKAVKIITTLFFFFWNGDKGGSKTKGWGTQPCGNVQEALQ